MKNYKFISIIKEILKKYMHNDVFATAAEVTYYLILSLFPFVIILVTLLSFTKISQTEWMLSVKPLIPDNAYKLFEDVISNAIQTRSEAFLSLSMLITIWSASSGAQSFIKGLNKAYNLKEHRSYIRVKLLSILLILGLSMVIIFSLVLVIFGELITSYLFDFFGFTSSIKLWIDILRFMFTIITMYIIFMLLYYYTPCCKIYLKDTIPGATLSTVGWIVLSLGFSFYVNNFANYSKTYGSIGAIIVLLIWLYWSSAIVLSGAELNSVLLKNKKNHIRIKRI